MTQLALAAMLLFAVAPPKPVIVPLESLRTQHVTVQVMVNEAGPFRLVFDTGSPLTIVSSRVAREAGLVSPALAARPAFLGMRGEVKAKSFRLVGREGAAAVNDYGMQVLDHPLIGALAQHEGPIDGIVGLSFFGRFRTTLDYDAGTLALAPGRYQPDDVLHTLVARITRGEARRVVLAPGALLGLRVAKPDDAPGVEVVEVLDKSAAAAAGLRVGDRLLALDGRWTDSIADWLEAGRYLIPGRVALVKVLRSGAELALNVNPRNGL